MGKNKRRWYVFFCFLIGGGGYLGSQLLIGRSMEKAGLETIIWVAVMGLVVLIPLPGRRKSLARMSAPGEVFVFIRRLAAPERDRYRKWKSAILVPDHATLKIHPTLGGSLIRRGSPFTVTIYGAAGSRHSPTTWEKINRLSANCVILSLETNEGPVEIAAEATTLDTIESSLNGTVPSHSLPRQPEPR